MCRMRSWKTKMAKLRNSCSRFKEKLECLRICGGELNFPEVLQQFSQ